MVKYKKALMQLVVHNDVRETTHLSDHFIVFWREKYFSSKILSSNIFSGVQEQIFLCQSHHNEAIVRQGPASHVFAWSMSDHNWRCFRRRAFDGTMRTCSPTQRAYKRTTTVSNSAHTHNTNSSQPLGAAVHFWPNIFHISCCFQKHSRAQSSNSCCIQMPNFLLIILTIKWRFNNQLVVFFPFKNDQKWWYVWSWCQNINTVFINQKRLWYATKVVQNVMHTLHIDRIGPFLPFLGHDVAMEVFRKPSKWWIITMCCKKPLNISRTDL